MFSLITKLKFDAPILPKLREALTIDELIAFNSLCGSKLEAIEKINTEKYTKLIEAQQKHEAEESKKIEEENQRQREEDKRRLKDFQERMTRMKEEFTTTLDSVFDPVIKAGEDGVSKLKESTPTLADFYRYFNCDEFHASAQDVLNNLQSRVAASGCDYSDYGNAIEQRFLELLSTQHPDTNLRRMAGMLVARHNDQEDETENSKEDFYQGMRQWA
jgi:hypothetical protein